MSLFETMSDLSKQHAKNSGSYTFEKPAEPEPAPSVSLYNLLDYSVDQLDHIHNVITLGLQKLDSIKLAKSATYMDGAAFARILETLKKEQTKP